MKGDVLDRGFLHVMPDSAELELLADDLRLSEGPVWEPEEGALYFTEILPGIIWRWDSEVGRKAFLQPSGHANGMALEAPGSLVVAGWSARSIWRADLRSGERQTLVTEYEGRRINTPNDIVVDREGGILWTDPSSALLSPGMAGDDVQRYLDFHGVFRRAADGAVSLLVDDFVYPNGLCFSPDGGTLYIDDTRLRHVRVFSVGSDGQLGEGRLFYELVGEEPGAADGLKTDIAGNVYVTGPAGIHVIGPEGKLLGRIRVPAHVTNMGWGGPDGRWLYITSFTSLFRIHLGIPGSSTLGWV